MKFKFLKGVYFKKAYGESSMAVIQYTKKIASLKDYAIENGLSVDQNALEVGQGKNSHEIR